MNISDMKPGETRVINGYKDDQLSLKLMEMGCLPGSKVSMNYSAPLGDPVCIHIEGYDLSLRLSEASIVMVE